MAKTKKQLTYKEAKAEAVAAAPDLSKQIELIVSGQPEWKASRERQARRAEAIRKTIELWPEEIRDPDEAAFFEKMEIWDRYFTGIEDGARRFREQRRAGMWKEYPLKAVPVEYGWITFFMKELITRGVNPNRASILLSRILPKDAPELIFLEAEPEGLDLLAGRIRAIYKNYKQER